MYLNSCYQPLLSTSEVSVLVMCHLKRPLSRQPITSHLHPHTRSPISLPCPPFPTTLINLLSHPWKPPGRRRPHPRRPHRSCRGRRARKQLEGLQTGAPEPLFTRPLVRTPHHHPLHSGCARCRKTTMHLTVPPPPPARTHTHTHTRMRLYTYTRLYTLAHTPAHSRPASTAA